MNKILLITLFYKFSVYQNALFYKFHGFRMPYFASFGAGPAVSLYQTRKVDTKIFFSYYSFTEVDIGNVFFVF